MLAAKRDQNRVLAALPYELWTELEGNFELVGHAEGERLNDRAKSPPQVVFPLTGTIVSLCLTLAEGGRVEAATIGAEGMVGGLITASEHIAFTDETVQVPGQSLRIPSAAFGRVSEHSFELRDIVARYADALLAQLLQAVVCNAVHPMQQRLARWLLVTQDRIAGNELPLTQEYLAQMLGVHRATVIRILRPLREGGVIEYGRGRLKIVSRSKLERASCECYEAVRRHYDRVLGRRPDASPRQTRSVR